MRWQRAGQTFDRCFEPQRDCGGGTANPSPNTAIVSVPAYDGSTVKTVFLGNDGGVYKAADITTATLSSGWTNLNNGLAVTQFYSVATNVATGSIVGGTQDNGTLRTPGSGTTWSTVRPRSSTIRPNCPREG